MNKLKNNILLSLVLVAVWIVLNGNFTLPTVFTGMVMAVITIMLLAMLHPHQSDLYDYHINPLTLALFLAVLFKNIYISAFKTSVNLIKGRIDPKFVTVTTRIHRPWLQSLIGNAITLTPGTVTVHLAKNRYVALWLCPESEDLEQIREELLGEFEDALAKGDRDA
ncbi:MAG: Na+/H+ antiporter subunit E [Erysipelotrichaceae bacterium]|nr:Na+/H+ antiporter subunit E [Erysipelotrichaceae bacterium]